MEYASPQGLWDRTAQADVETPRLDGDLDCEAAIVGGGFCGLSAALHLAEAGVDAVVLEAETPGWGASGRNGGQVIAGLKLDPRECQSKFGAQAGRALARFGAGTADLVFELIERFQIRCEAHRNGWLQAARGPAVLAEIARRVADIKAEGGYVELIGQEHMAELTGSSFYQGAMLDRRSGSVQPLGYARGLAAAALKTGARIFRDARVTALVSSGAGWRLTTARGTVSARHCLIATNGYTGDLHPALRTAMIATQSYQIATDPLPAALDRTILPSRLPVSDLPFLGVYFRRDDAGRFVIGGRGSLTDRERPDLFAALERHAYRIYPALTAVGFSIRWGGKLAVTKDHLPRLVTLEPGLHAAYGCNGRGVALATAMGKLAAERIRGIEHADLPIANLPPARYALYPLRLPAMMAIARYRRLRTMFVRG
jgi:glycine/D-amino acid oxidase-like deaminating enzyme